MSGRAARASKARKQAKQAANRAALVVAAAMEDFRRTWWEFHDRVNSIYLLPVKPLPTGSVRYGGKMHYFDSVPNNGTQTPEGA